MLLIKISLIFGLVSFSVAGYATSYAKIVKHDDFHGIGGYGKDYGYYGHNDQQDYNSYPHYKFQYGVKDHHSGDNKNQWEERDGDKVKGGYELVEADGTKRIVEYTADDHNGFKAIVKRIGHAKHPQVYGHQYGHEYGQQYGHRYDLGYHNGYGYEYGHGL